MSLVDNLCAEAVDKILQLVHGTPHLYDITEQNSDTVIVPQTSEGVWEILSFNDSAKTCPLFFLKFHFCFTGGDGGRDPVSSDHTYILVSEVRKEILSSIKQANS